MSADGHAAPRGRLRAWLDQAAARARPVGATIEITHACNVACAHCYLERRGDRASGALALAEWRRIIDELSRAGALYLTITGGEPLARRDWHEIAAHARGRGLALRLYTNATLVGERTADRIAALRPLAVEVSLHGATAATVDAITGRPGAFARALRGIRRLRARGVRVLLKCVVMTPNVHELARLRALAASLGADLLLDAEVAPKNDGTAAPAALALGDRPLARAAGEILGAWGRRAPATCFDRAARLDDGPCAAGRRTLHVGPTGDLHPCTQWTAPVGSLRERAFADLWQAPALRRIRATTVGDLTACRDCEVLAVCTPCMALNLLETGTLAGPSPTRCRSARARAHALGRAGGAGAGATRGRSSGGGGR